MLKRPFILITVLAVTFACCGFTCSAGDRTTSGQQPQDGQGLSSTLKFNVDMWDFGKIKEVDGPVTHTFEFTNTGDNAIVIERVSVSCGCTTPSYSREPVMPGKKGEVKVTYDPDMRPGRFSKDVYVISNNGKNNNKLTIKGEVEGKPRSVEQDYPYLLGNGLRFNSLSVNYRYVAQGTPTTTTLGYANTSDKTIKAGFEVVPDNGVIRVESPGDVCRDCKGELQVTASVPRGDTYGRQDYRIIPVVDGEKIYPGISVTFIATDDFSRGNEENAPQARYSAAYHNFGTLAAGEKPEYTFTLTNDGRSDLIIRSITAQEGFNIALGEGTRIGAGKTINIRCTLDTSGARTGTFTKVASIVTNDPSRPMRELRLAASVQAK